MLTGRALSDVWPSQLRREVRTRDPKEIFCGDVIFYRALRAMFPERPITVRLHNYFTLARTRWRSRDIPLDLHFRLTLELTSRLERRIMRDPLVRPIFINRSEQRCFQLCWPGRSSDLWPVHCTPLETISSPQALRLIYFGGTGSHQACGLRHFIGNAYRRLAARRPKIEFHLWGEGTEAFDRAAPKVFGHGRWTGDGLPHSGDGLFVIPDLLGGGVKVKTGDSLSLGLPFITTPFGAEGYQFSTAPGRFVADLDDWDSVIDAYFESVALV
jgi:hypothetical protein